MSQRSFASIGAWVGIAVFLWLMAWIIAESIPGFNNLLSLIVSVLFPFRKQGWLVAGITKANKLTKRILLGQTALFASWFTRKSPRLAQPPIFFLVLPCPPFHPVLKLVTNECDQIVALNGWFGLHLDKGSYFSSPKKIMVTCLNIFCVGSGIFVVSSLHT